MDKILITAFLLILPLTNISHPHEEDPYTTYIQEKLIDLGFLDTATGVNDKNTQEAIKIFQEKAGLVVDGMVGNLTFPKLLLGEKAYSSVLINNDNNPPVWSSDPLTIININQSSGQKSTSMSATVLWGQVTDDIGIHEYKIYVDDELYTTIPGEGCVIKCSSLSSGKSARVLNLIKDEKQTIKVSACDYEGNCSTNNPTITKYFTIESTGGGGQSKSGNVSNTGFLSTFGVSGLDTDVAGVAIDSSDNIYITGTSQGANVFGKNATSGTTDDIFVAKLNSSGVVQWVYAAGGTGRDRGRKIALDSSGNIYVTGYYWSTVDFGGGNVTSNGNWDAFLLKLNSSGTFQWVKSYGYNYNDLGRDVAIDSNDNIYMLGNYRGTVDFGGGDEIGANNGDIFLVKFNSSGVFQWVYTAGASATDDSRALALDSNDNPYITGSFRDTVNFGGGNITAANLDDLFILKLNSSGAYQNIYTSNIFTTQKGKGLAVDSSGNIYATGTFSGTVDFGGGNITTSGSDIYLLKLNSSFAFQWVKRFAVDNGSAGQALGLAVTVDEDGNVYSVGQIGSSVDLGGGTQNFGNQNDAYIVKYDSSGSFQWSKHFGSGSQNNIDKAQDIVIDSNGFVITVGEVESQNIDFTSVGDGVLTNYVTGDNPNFVLKIKSDTGLID
ncbi:SBBP repeat-containing protein [Candidatus Actinomarina]|nr:SBBP repeat-containing protein [Candidatus Actinomarina sp.]